MFATEIDAQIAIAIHYAGPEDYVTVLNPRPSIWVVYVDSEPTGGRARP